MNINWKSFEREVLQKLDIKAEAESLGVRFTSAGESSWISCHAIDREDNNPSAAICTDSSHSMAGRYKDFGDDEKSMSFWDLASKLGPFSDWREAQKHYANLVRTPYPQLANNSSRFPSSSRKRVEEMVEEIKNDSLRNQKFKQWAEVKTPVEVQSIIDSGATLMNWPKGALQKNLCIGFQAKNSRGETTGIILYRVDGKDFSACEKGPGQRKTHMVRGSKDGWVIIGGKERFKKAAVVWKVEGIPDALALHSHLPENHVVVTNICGALPAGKCYPKLFKGKRVYAIGDADLTGERGVKKFAQSMEVYASSIHLVSLPYEITEKHGKDLRDFFNEGHNFKELQDQASGLSTLSPEEVSNSRGRKEIEITPDEKELNNHVVEALRKHPDLYQREGSLVHIVHDDSNPDGIRKDKISPRIVKVSEATLRELLTEVVYFYIQVENEHKVSHQQKSPTLYCVRAILDRGYWPGIRNLNGVTECPVLRPDGTILSQPGYDEKTGLIYLPNGNFPPVPENPNSEEIKLARELLLDLVCDFPFAKKEHRSTWVTSLLTPLARWAFADTAPLFLIDANVRGSGKSLLSDLVGMIILGRPMSRMSNPRDDEEARKKITSLALYGDNLVLIDNIVGSLGCSSLDQALTGTTWKDRILGRNEIVELPLNMTWYATGNNVVLKADTSRRVAHIRMDSPLEKPEERKGFKYPHIMKHVRENRGKLVSASLTILRGFYVAGRPDQNLTPWGSFDHWSDVVRSSVVWCGLSDPGNTREELANESDNEAMALRGVISGLEELDSEKKGLTASQIIKNLEDHPNDFELLRSSLLELCPARAGRMPSSKSLGSKLGHLKNRIAGGKAIKRQTRNKMAVWSVEELQVKDYPEGGSSGCSGPFTSPLYVKEEQKEDISYESGYLKHPEGPEEPPLADEQQPGDRFDWTEELFPMDPDSAVHKKSDF